VAIGGGADEEDSSSELAAIAFNSDPNKIALATSPLQANTFAAHGPVVIRPMTERLSRRPSMDPFAPITSNALNKRVECDTCSCALPPSEGHTGVADAVARHSSDSVGRGRPDGAAKARRGSAPKAPKANTSGYQQRQPESCLADRRSQHRAHTNPGHKQRTTRNQRRRTTQFCTQWLVPYAQNEVSSLLRDGAWIETGQLLGPCFDGTA